MGNVPQAFMIEITSTATKNVYPDTQVENNES